MIGSVLKKLLNEKEVTVNELSKRVGASPQTLYSVIKRDNNKIDFDLLLRICGELDVPMELFYGEKASPRLPDTDEMELLGKYRVLDDHGKKLANLVVNTEYERILSSRKVEKLPGKVIPLYATPAAAGYANPILGEDFEDYEVPFDSHADFAVRIQGDSMEPYIADGSIVLVSRTQPLADGDVGLFFVDGDSICKQYCADCFGNIYLFSLNRKRADADRTISSGSGLTVFCFGKVLLPKRPPLP